MKLLIAIHSFIFGTPNPYHRPEVDKARENYLRNK